MGNKSERATNNKNVNADVEMKGDCSWGGVQIAQNSNVPHS
jgi:hypothetical protein